MNKSINAIKNQKQLKINTNKSKVLKAVNAD
jgi:hypothetical protein